MPIPCDLAFQCTIHREPKKIVSDAGICLDSWDKATKLQLSKYLETLEYFASKVPCATLRCNNMNCQDIEHIQQLDRVYVFIVKCILDTSDELPLYTRTDKYEKVVGWNEHCKRLYRDA